MSRKIFISYQHRDQMKAKGFNLLRWNNNVDLEFVGRHLLDPVDSESADYVRSKVREQLKGTSVTIVLVGQDTHESDWVAWEVEESLAKDSPNGILAIRLYDDAPLPSGSPVTTALETAGAEIIDWEPEKFGDAIERAAIAAGRIRAIHAVVVGRNVTCVR
jgi:hypothetical protein